MKHIFAFIFTLCCVATISAQGVVRTGLYAKDGAVVYSDPQSSVTVAVTVKSTIFTPGEFARYAQKMLGVRASLAEKRQSEIISAEVLCGDREVEVTKQTNTTAVESVLPIYKSDNRAQSVEQQAAAAAEMIFAMRRSRKELISGDAKIDAMEQQCLDMFYGTTTTTIERKVFHLTPNASEKNYILARYRDGVGFLPIDELSGEPIMVCFTPQSVDTSAMPLATEKDKNKGQFIVPAACKVELLLGTQTLDELSMPIYQYGQRVVLALPSSK